MKDRIRTCGFLRSKPSLTFAVPSFKVGGVRSTNRENAMTEKLPVGPIGPPEMWESIQDAFAYVLAGKAKRLDGDGWTVYAAGTIIRIDVRTSE